MDCCKQRAPILVALAFLTGAQSIAAQTASASAAASITVTAAYPTDRHIATGSPIELTLSRLPSRTEGTLTVMVGAVDMTALFVRRDRRLAFRTGVLPLPSGESEVAVYLVNDAAWTELARFPLRVLTRQGFTSATAKPSLSMSNSGQLAEGRTPAPVSPSTAPAFDDVRFTAGVRTAHARSGWSVETHENAVGVTDGEQALRFGELGRSAPNFDLSDYVITTGRSGVKLALGNTTFGDNRHLMNGFASRGATVSLGGPRFTASLGTLGGTAIVGWGDLLGFTRPGHRISAGSLGMELFPQRPGALRVDILAMNGSLLPRTGFTQNALTDAERSSGNGVSVTASLPSQRARVVAGFSRSRFVNPVDTLLSGGEATTPVLPVARSARFIESGLTLLQNSRVAGLTTDLSANFRHERVDPLFRSVGASTAADVLMNAMDVNGKIGVLSIQAAHARSHDNLAGIPSILRTLTRASSAQAALPLASLSDSRGGTAWPLINYSVNRTHQLGNGVPPNSGFTAADVPDQRMTVHEANAQWQGERWRAGYRFSRSLQDDRRSGNEQSDFGANAHAMSLAMTIRPTLEVGAELAAERQRDIARDLSNSVNRIGISTSWRPSTKTTLTGNFTTSRSNEQASAQRGNNNDVRLELSQEVARIRTMRGQLFLRFARQGSATIRRLEIDPLFERDRRVAWTLTSGLNLQLF